MKTEMWLRVILIDPPAGVLFAVQRGRDELLPAFSSTADRICFEFPVYLIDANSQPPRITGAYAQGPAAARFVYVNSGTAAGQVGSCWTRRIKVPLRGLGSALLQSLGTANEYALAAEISGRARDGGPACATVPLLSDWRRMQRTASARA